MKVIRLWLNEIFSENLLTQFSQPIIKHVWWSLVFKGLFTLTDEKYSISLLRCVHKFPSIFCFICELSNKIIVYKHEFTTVEIKGLMNVPWSTIWNRKINYWCNRNQSILKGILICGMFKSAGKTGLRAHIFIFPKMSRVRSKENRNIPNVSHGNWHEREKSFPWRYENCRMWIIKQSEGMHEISFQRE